MKISLSLPHVCTVHHTLDGLVIEFPDAAVPEVAAQLGCGARLTLAQVCERYNKTAPTIRQWERLGLKSIRIGRSKFYAAEELARFEQAQRQGAILTPHRRQFPRS